MELSGEFASALWNSPTFWPLVAWWGGGLVSGFLVCAALSLRWLRRPRWRGLHADDRGVAVAVEFVLVLPLFLTILMMTVQFAVLLNGSLVTHYAAYAAARSARAHVFDIPFQSLRGGLFRNGSLADPRSPGISKNHPVNRHALNAARVALIAASPGNASATTARNTEPWLRNLVTASNLATGSYRNTLERKAGWAFDPKNTSVEIVVRSQRSGFFGPSVFEIEATVDFAQYIALVPGRIFGTDRGDAWVANTTATVRLL